MNPSARRERRLDDLQPDRERDRPARVDVVGLGQRVGDGQLERADVARDDREQLDQRRDEEDERGGRDALADAEGVERPVDAGDLREPRDERRGERDRRRLRVAEDAQAARETVGDAPDLRRARRSTRRVRSRPRSDACAGGSARATSCPRARARGSRARRRGRSGRGTPSCGAEVTNAVATSTITSATPIISCSDSTVPATTDASTSTPRCSEPAAQHRDARDLAEPREQHGVQEEADEERRNDVAVAGALGVRHGVERRLPDRRLREDRCEVRDQREQHEPPRDVDPIDRAQVELAQAELDECGHDRHDDDEPHARDAAAPARSRRARRPSRTGSPRRGRRRRSAARPRRSASDRRPARPVAVVQQQDRAGAEARRPSGSRSCRRPASPCPTRPSSSRRRDSRGPPRPGARTRLRKPCGARKNGVGSVACAPRDRDLGSLELSR